MKTISKREQEYLTTYVGKDGTDAHYWGGTPLQRETMQTRTRKDRKNTNQRAAAQVEQMRQGVGGKKAKTAREKARVIKQVTEMRQAACPVALAGIIDVKEQAREAARKIAARILAEHKIDDYVNPLRH